MNDGSPHLPRRALVTEEQRGICPSRAPRANGGQAPHAGRVSLPATGGSYWSLSFPGRERTAGSEHPPQENTERKLPRALTTTRNTP